MTPRRSATAAGVPGSHGPASAVDPAPDQGDVDLDAWSFCFFAEAEDGSSSRGSCADGAPPEHPPELRADGAATFAFPLDGWEFSADFHPAGERAERCRREWSTRCDTRATAT